LTGHSAGRGGRCILCARSGRRPFDFDLVGPSEHGCWDIHVPSQRPSVNGGFLDSVRACSVVGDIDFEVWKRCSSAWRRQWLRQRPRVGRAGELCFDNQSLHPVPANRSLDDHRALSPIPRSQNNITTGSTSRCILWLVSWLLFGSRLLDHFIERLVQVHHLGGKSGACNVGRLDKLTPLR
jgi:hypothetical protein